MNIVKTDYFDEVESIRLGYGPIGPPLMSVFVYVVDSLVIDTGQSHMAKALLELLRDKRLSGIVLTHHHEDHSGNAAGISAQHSIPVRGRRLTAAKMEGGFSIRPYQRYVWGKALPVDVIPFDGVIESDRFTFTPVHTPGHARDHTVFLEKRQGWLFSGDLYLGERIKFFRADERFGEQIASLKKVLALDFDALFCAHNPCLRNGKQKIKNKLQFLEDLYGSVSELAQKGHSEKAVIKALDPRNDRTIKWITMGNVSFANMVRSAMASVRDQC
ncbi:MAG: MBL fold metallo-hydrolase [Deltaproteobacteria bacterium]|nr:MBL fold metallo-hydrolase [Deltaproteobacteria bacterium]